MLEAGGVSLFQERKLNMLDEVQTSVGGSESSPATEVSGSSPDTGVASGAGSNATGEQSQSTQSGEQVQGTEAPTVQTDDEKYAIPENADIRTLREKYELLNNDHRSLKQSTEPLNAWKPLVDQYQAPEQVQTLIDVANGLFAPVIENGQQVYRDGLPATTTLPAIQRLAQESPATLIQLSEDLANFEIQGKSVIDWQLEAIGLDPNDIPQYLEWKKNGLNVAQQGGDISAEDLQKIPGQYHEIFKSLPLETREDILYASELGREFMLRTAKESADMQTWKHQQQTEQQQQMEQAQVRQRQEISQAQDVAVNDVWSSTFKSLHDDLASKGWKPSADENASGLQYTMLLAAVHGMTNPALAPLIEPVLQSAGIQLDKAKLTSLLNEIDVSTRSHIGYEKTGDIMNARISKANADRANFQLKTLANGAIAQLIGVLDGSLAERRQVQDSRLQGATSRTVLSGQATNGSGANPFALPPGVEPYSQAAIEHKQRILQSQFANRS